MREKGTSTTQLLPAGWPAARALLAFQEGCGRTACGLVSASGAPLLTALVQTAPPAQHSMHSAAQHAQHITALPQHSTGSPPPSTTLTKVITGCWQLCSARCHCQVGQLITALQPVPQGGACRGVSLCLRACLQAGSPTCSGLGLPPRSGRGGYLAPCSRSISTSSGQPAVPSGVDAAPSRSKAICSYSHCSARQISCQVRRYISLTAPKAACTPAPTSPLLSRPALACRARCHERRRFGWVSAVDCRAVCQQNARWRHVGAHAGHL